jgi:DNA-binding transcriptional MocR family regulator
MSNRDSRHRRRRTQFSGTFAGRLIEMLECPAYRILSVSAHRALARIEIEFAHHGGNENGRLPVTFDHFQEYGMDRHTIAPALRELAALGFIEVTERGCAGNAGFRRPNLYRLTYKACDGVLSDGTHEWRRIKTIEEAREVATAARKMLPENRVGRDAKRVRRRSRINATPQQSSKIKTAVGKTHTSPSGGNPH